MAQPKPGDYWVRYWFGMPIYGYAMTEDDLLESERVLGADEEELVYTLRNFRRAETFGCVFGKAYSMACPEGEYGSTPVSDATLITQEEFQEAKRREWSD